MQTQSFLSTMMRGRMGVYETRIFAHIVAGCQELIHGNQFVKRAYQIPDGWSTIFCMSLGDITNSNNYKYAKAAATNLTKLTVEHYDPGMRIWSAAPLVKEARIEERTGLLYCEVANWAVQCIIDFRYGWRTYELQDLLSLRNSNAMRLYMLTCTSTESLTYRIDTLRALMLGTDSKKYPHPSDFLRRVLTPAAKELQQRGLNGFTFKAMKSGRGKHAPITHVLITPCKREQRDTENASATYQQMVRDVPASLIAYLTTQCGFTQRELRGKNMDTFRAFAALSDWQPRLVAIVDRARKGRKGHGYIIQGIKDEITGTKHY